jgi:hypothetical protein
MRCAHDCCDADGEADQGQQDPQMLTRETRARVRPRTSDLDERDHGPSERTRRTEHPLLSRAHVFERRHCHWGSVGTPVAGVIAGRVETDSTLGWSANSTEHPMTRPPPLHTVAEIAEIVVSDQAALPKE